MARLLETSGYKAVEAANGKEALARMRQRRPCVILLDLQMPIMDGYEALRVLRAQNYNKPIVALTAHAMKEERQRCLEIGFDAHIGKPVTRDLLLRTVARYAMQSHH